MVKKLLLWDFFDIQKSHKQSDRSKKTSSDLVLVNRNTDTWRILEYYYYYYYSDQIGFFLQRALYTRSKVVGTLIFFSIYH